MIFQTKVRNTAFDLESAWLVDASRQLYLYSLHARRIVALVPMQI